MLSIKLYQTRDWLCAYLKSWGYQDEQLVDELLTQLTEQEKKLQIEDISSFLNKRVLDYLDQSMEETLLLPMQKLHYFKMIFLMKKIYLKCNIFGEISIEQEAYLQSCFNENLYQVAPDILHSNMFRQSIKTYHPVWKIKKTIVKGLQKIIRPKKG